MGIRDLRISRLIIIALLIIATACTNETERARVVNKIAGFENDTMFVTISEFDHDESYIFDTLICKNGEFAFDTLITKLYHGYIVSKGIYETLDNGSPYLLRSKIISFFIAPGEKISINGKNDEYLVKYKLFGNNLNNQLNEYRDLFSDDFAEIVKIDFELENLYINNAHDSIINELTLKQRDLIHNRTNKDLSFIRLHPDYEFSAYLLNKQTKDTIRKYFPVLTTNVKESDYGRLIQAKIDLWNSIKIGLKAPDFKYTTLEGETFQLSNVNGKYIVLDFWGTWCGSCVKGIPKMKEYHEKYNTDVTFIGIACRDTKSDLLNVIDKYELPWIQILNNENEGNNLWLKYNVEGFPTKFIINREGVIEGIFLGETNDFYKKLDELFSTTG